MKNEKGITLIALVITIIVMLILVTLVIRLAVDGGLFDYAEKAVEETKGAIENEQEQTDGRIQVNGVLYNSLNEYLESNKMEE